ncbi:MULTISPECIES: DUF3107 domain-containing protein [Prauserella]|uniref:ATP-binding protein n=2 Tax=Prauserella TaxID=142577 RepID=A0A318LY36_9PSEU|nr:MULTISPECIES: DUF3107 domain-containing protein [Prauserella]PXY19888.1 ATP-binding protein [Prauserella coralliicola]PXY37379.1 ATP-binding protein [Prauserella flavalba]RBM11216.1 DUF3107 domain-containing protein [Prauserella sp. PE36]TKG64469.1 DUF3107 domain-containing protein [Prauserella endophytica]
MEVKIGIKDTPRELVVSSGQSAEEVEKLVADALGADSAANGLFRLTDDKGRKYLVPSDRIAYVEIAPSDVRKVGFAVGS